MRATTLALVVLALVAQAGVALAGPAPVPLAATYEAAPPAQMGAATGVKVTVKVTNTGEETWLGYDPGQPPQRFSTSLAYHWYDGAGNVVVWDGARTALGFGAVDPGQSRTVEATVDAPTRPGTYLLRFALVKEGFEWLPPGQPYAVEVIPAYGARITPPPASPLVTGQTYVMPIVVQNVGAVAWTTTAPGLVTASYHWHDERGNTVVWDGIRTPLPADVAPGATTTINVRVATPERSGTYLLTFDLVREGVSWFAGLGSTAAAVGGISVAPVTYAAQYDVRVSAATYIGEVKSIPVSVTNRGNVPWNADNVVNLAYHIYDARGNVVVWDGERTKLGDVAVGETKQVMLQYTSPTVMGDYVLAIDAVREGVSWFSGLGVQTVRLPMKVDSGYAVGYGATTTPGLATIGARVTLRVQVDNYGPRTLTASGASPVRLSYHLYTAAGQLLQWEGERGALPFDLQPGQSASVEVDVQLPARVGDYVIAWDLVQEGVAWLSQLQLPVKREAITVQPGVTFYGKGFGHGLGMSQYGAQGMATGAGGRPPMSGEQIVSYYYPGTQLTPIPTTGDNTRIRVLLSQPSSQGRQSCGAAYFAGTIANLSSQGGFRVLNEGQGDQEIFRASPGVSVQIEAVGGVVRVWNQATSTPTPMYMGPGPIVIVPLDPAVATTFVEKGVYRGNFRFTNLGNTLRVLNVVSYDDYIRGVVPLEMLNNWHLEAYKAQAIAARTYAFSSYVGGRRDYDVLDDQSDQCYGGVQMKSGRVVESAITNRAVELTLGRILTYDGLAIRAYFASSNGGYSKPVGCWNNNVVTSSGAVTCSASPPYLTAVQDPWDLQVTQPNPNRNVSWQVTFDSERVRQAVLNLRGIDIGTLLSVDLSNRVPAVVGHVVSVRLVGSRATVDVNADKLLREQLLLRSTMVRLAPW